MDDRSAPGGRRKWDWLKNCGKEEKIVSSRCGIGKTDHIGGKQKGKRLL